MTTGEGIARKSGRAVADGIVTDYTASSLSSAHIRARIRTFTVDTRLSGCAL